MDSTLKSKEWGDFLVVLRENEDTIRQCESAGEPITPRALARCFLVSQLPRARRFTYVFGSMKGDIGLQYRTAIERFRKDKHPDSGRAAAEMERRSKTRCIDIQECMWLVSAGRGGDLSKDYGYRDLYEYAGKLPWSGNARSGYTIDWGVVAKL